MKKVISLIAVMAICFAVACPVFATEDGFVPSIPYKGAPDIVPVEDGDGEPAIGVVRDEDGDAIDYLYGPCLVVTPVSEAKTSTLIPDAAEVLLLDVYDRLNKGTMTIPYEKHGDDLKNKEMVIRDLFDVSWLCSDHPVIVAEPGVTVELTFNLGVAKNVDVYCMSYKNSEWNPIVSTVNNGDGTVTCVFEDFCPVEFSVVRSGSPSKTGDDVNVGHWLILLVLSAAALVILMLPKRRHNAR